jgi:hypothetical protein
MRVIVETFYDDAGTEIGELVIESDDLEFKVVHCGNNYNEKGKRLALNTKHFVTMGGALRELLRRKLKASKHETIEALLEGLGEIDNYIREKTALVVAAREPQKKRIEKGAVKQ